MSLEDQYDAWVRGLMGGNKYAATSNSRPRMPAMPCSRCRHQLEALTAAQKAAESAASSALDAVQKAGRCHRRECAQDEQRADKIAASGRAAGRHGWPRPPPAPKRPSRSRHDFTGVTDKIKAQVLGQDAFVSALVKAFRRPFVLGTAEDTARARNLMLLCGPNGTGRHYALTCVVEELAARGILRSAAD